LHAFAPYNLLDFEGKLTLCIGCYTSVLYAFGHCNHCNAWSSIEHAKRQNLWECRVKP